MKAMECLDEYRTECELRNYSKRTIKGHYNNIRKFLTYIDIHSSITQIEDIKPPHIKKYVQYLISKDLKPTYINGILKSVRGYFKYAFSEGYILVNPVLRVGWQKEGKVVIQTFTDEEVCRMLSVFNQNTFLCSSCGDILQNITTFCD